MASSSDKAASTSLSSAALLLLQSLKANNPDIEEYCDAFLQAVATVLAEELEAAPNTAKRVRSLAYNLTRNEALRNELLSGAVTPKSMCAMDTSNWASAAVKRAREAAEERAQAQLRLASTGGEIYSITRKVRCPECGGKRAKFTHLGTDLKDWHGRKNEVWGTQNHDDDGEDCELVCTACDHTWRGAAPEEDDEEDADDLEESRRKDRVMMMPERESVHKRA